MADPSLLGDCLAEPSLAEVVSLTHILQVGDARVVRSTGTHMVRTMLYDASAQSQRITEVSDSLHAALNEPFAAMIEEVADYYDDLSSVSFVSSHSSSSRGTAVTYEDQLPLDPLDSLLVSTLRMPLQERRTRIEQSALLTGVPFSSATANSGYRSLSSHSSTVVAQQQQQQHQHPTDAIMEDEMLNTMLMIRHSFVASSAKHAGKAPPPPLALVGDSATLIMSAPATQEEQRRHAYGLDCMPRHIGGELSVDQYIALAAEHVGMLDTTPMVGASSLHTAVAAAAAVPTVVADDGGGGGGGVMYDNTIAGHRMDLSARKQFAKRRLTTLDVLRPKARLCRVDGAPKAPRTLANGAGDASNSSIGGGGGGGAAQGKTMTFTDIRCASFVHMSELALEDLILVVDGRTAANTTAVAPDAKERQRRARTDWTMSLSMRQLSDAMDVGDSLFASVQPEWCNDVTTTSSSPLSTSATTLSSVSQQQQAAALPPPPPPPTRTSTVLLRGLTCFDFCDYVDSATFAELRAQLIEACEQTGRRFVGEHPVAAIRRCAVVDQPQEIYTSKLRWHDQWRLILWRFARLLTMTPLCDESLGSLMSNAAMAAANNPTLAERMPISPQKSCALVKMRASFDRWGTLLINMLDSYMRQAYTCIAKGEMAKLPRRVFSRSTVEAALAATGNMKVATSDASLLPSSASTSPSAATKTTTTTTAVAAAAASTRLTIGNDDGDDDDDMMTPASGTERTDQDIHSGGGGSVKYASSSSAAAALDNGMLTHELAEAHGRYVQRLRDILTFAAEARFEQPAMLMDCVHAVVDSTCSPEPLSFDSMVCVNRIDLTANVANNARKNSGMESLYSTVKAERKLVFDPLREPEWRTVCAMPIVATLNNVGTPVWNDAAVKTFNSRSALGVRRLWRAIHCLLLRFNKRHAYGWTLLYLLTHRSLLIREGMWHTQFDRATYERLEMATVPLTERLSFARTTSEDKVNVFMRELHALAERLYSQGEIVIEDDATANVGLSSSSALSARNSARAPSTLSTMASSSSSQPRRKRKAHADNDDNENNRAIATTTAAAVVAATPIQSTMPVFDPQRPWTTLAEQPQTVLARVGHYPPACAPPVALLRKKYIDAEDFSEWLLQVARAEWQYLPLATLEAHHGNGAGGGGGDKQKNKRAKADSAVPRFSASKAIDALIEWNNSYAPVNPLLKHPNDTTKTGYGDRVLRALLPPADYEQIMQTKGGRANARLVLTYRQDSALARFMLQDEYNERFFNKRDGATLFNMAPLKIRPLHHHSIGSKKRSGGGGNVGMTTTTNDDANDVAGAAAAASSDMAIGGGGGDDEAPATAVEMTSSSYFATDASRPTTE